ncbi:UDP-N-acetylmuramoyl-L-alanyl-D-glutamate--2,6-diaminopimelate ligase [Corynebacterium freiburgense]|uniref:UDP-N-acetylmuramoyl-L-alanyl-D-glutamate--2, 6-diaminopimelate ligase n=1 Tax=Corynebacterium freiburgense TaxID=556548 RepID=UPI000403E145|nr:UDP-N-acetylmuramoyl-L-alanyl-D-glutamate--2,6-diaminopimelate ligase [Corynebacterium freiburgense]WJZ03162.1 UDP-N-acetylmuramoyl-L-alanyl-D-glutamate--2,6-diaminopimelate ligase [Corynebacterium freiburgense]
MDLTTLAKIAGGRLVNPADISINAIGLHAQELQSGGVFAAVPGSKAHGASFAKDSKASAILTDEQGLELLVDEHRPIVVVPQVRPILGPVAAAVYGDPSKHLTVIGITGTSGKTTTTHMLEVGLRRMGLKVGLIGTTGTKIDGEWLPTSLTTPEAPKLQELFALMLERGVTHVVMEVSSHALSLHRVDGISFDIAAFTNLSQDHLDFHHTMEEYFEAKAKFFQGMAAQNIAFAEDWGKRILDEFGGLAVGKITERAPQEFTVSIGDRDIDVELSLPGHFNVLNAALAVTCVAAVGLDPQEFAKGLKVVGVPGRMEVIDAGQEFLAVVDYAHKPAAVAAVLDALRQDLEKQQSQGRLGIVLGAGGDRDAGKRPIMGLEAARRADFVVVTDDNPRSEDPAAIRAAVLKGAKQGSAKVIEIGDRAKAIRAVVAWAKPGDAIVVAGKGHETGQLVQGVMHPFDDRLELAQALSEVQS